MKNKNLNRAAILGALTLFFTACEKAYFPQPPKAKVPTETAALEASFVSTAPITINDAYWKNADFLKVPVSDLNKGSLYPDGFLNMTGTYNGLTSFNKGADPKVVMKAAYDNTKLYLYIEWIDSDIDPAIEASWLYGPADPLKTDTTGGWTSQGNSDKLALAFDIAKASSSAGTFADKGCAAIIIKCNLLQVL